MLPTNRLICIFAALLGFVPEGKRDLFIDHLEGVPNAELAEIYGYSSAATVRQTLMRIRQDLKRDIEAAGLMKGLWPQIDYWANHSSKGVIEG